MYVLDTTIMLECNETKLGKNKGHKELEFNYKIRKS